MPLLFGVVQSVPDNKDILDREPHKLDRDMLAAPRRFVQKAHAAKRPRVLGQQALTRACNVAPVSIMSSTISTSFPRTSRGSRLQTRVSEDTVSLP